MVGKVLTLQYVYNDDTSYQRHDLVSFCCLYVHYRSGKLGLEEMMVQQSLLKLELQS